MLDDAKVRVDEAFEVAKEKAKTFNNETTANINKWSASAQKKFETVYAGLREKMEDMPG